MDIGQTINSNKIIKQYSPLEFVFIDDPQWRAAITSIACDVPGWNKQELLGGLLQIGPGKISGPVYYFGLGFWTWTIKATGYPDTVVTVTVIE